MIPMNNFIKKTVSLCIGALMTVSSATGVFAAQVYEDMPNDWRTTAIENAVKNGLIYGTSDTTISPDTSITRAQMASIIVRALGATKETDISGYSDVDTGKWYYKELAKAVQMGAFLGSDNKMNPDGEITFEECFTVLSKVFGLDIRTTEDNAKLALSVYQDGGEVSGWAKKYYGSIVLNGYWSGGEKKLLTPKACITRGEFAVVMDNLIKTYISEPTDAVNIPKDGNVLVRCDGAKLDNIELNGDLIIGDGVSANGVSLKDINVKGRLVVRGCAADNAKPESSNGISVGEGSAADATDEITCIASGYAENIEIVSPYIFFVASNLKHGQAPIYGVKNSKIYMGSIDF